MPHKRSRAQKDTALAVVVVVVSLSGSLERGLSELAAAIADAVSRTEENAKQALLSQVSFRGEASGLESNDGTLCRNKLGEKSSQ